MAEFSTSVLTACATKETTLFRYACTRCRPLGCAHSMHSREFAPLLAQSVTRPALCKTLSFRSRKTLILTHELKTAQTATAIPESFWCALSTAKSLTVTFTSPTLSQRHLHQPSSNFTARSGACTVRVPTAYVQYKTSHILKISILSRKGPRVSESDCMHADQARSRTF